MLDSVNMKTTVTKDEFKKQSKKLEKELETLPQQIKQAQIPVIILFEGWGAAGKGGIISDLILNFDPRGFKVYSTAEPTEEEKRHPPMWQPLEKPSRKRANGHPGQKLVSGCFHRPGGG